ncbi:MAG: hypothetical protein ACTSQQ_17215 [Candidatus Helarchaeota archaeon]
MDQIILVDEVINSLHDAGYSVLSMGIFFLYYWNRSSFDIAARHPTKNLLLLIKIYKNIDKIRPELIADIKLISYFFKGSPLIIGSELRKRTDQADNSLRVGVVYERQGIPAVDIKTFKNLLKENKLYIISRKGGFYIQIDSNKVQQLRLSREMSLKEIATRLGVSRKAAYLFEHETRIKEANAMELEKLFDEDIKQPIDVFQWEIDKEDFQSNIQATDLQAEIKEILDDLGCNIFWAKKAPFDAITSEIEESTKRNEDLTLITGLSLTRRMQIYNRLKIISDLSKITRKLSMFIIEEGKLPIFDNVLVIQKAILEKMKDIHELYKQLKKVKRTFY